MFNLFRLLSQQLHSIREWWHNKTPANKWNFIIKIGQMSSNSIGIHVYDHRKVSWFTATGGVFLVLFFVLNIYTMQYYWLRSAFVRGLECTYLVGFVIGVRTTSSKFHRGQKTFKTKFWHCSFLECVYVLGIGWTTSF